MAAVVTQIDNGNQKEDSPENEKRINDSDVEDTNETVKRKKKRRNRHKKGIYNLI